MPYPTPEPGQVWESRDQQYEPGRLVRVDMVDANRVSVTTIANPERPHRVGSSADLQVTTLRKRWRLTTQSEQGERR